MPNRNGIVHEGIIDDLRFGLQGVINRLFPNFNVWIVADEGTMAGIANGGEGKCIRPDLILLYPNEFMYIEVGHMYHGKWEHLKERDDIKIVNVSHEKAVGLIQGVATQNTKKVLELIRNILGVC